MPTTPFIADYARITVEGSRSFRILQTRAQTDGLLWRAIERMPDAGSVPVANGSVPLRDIMSALAFLDLLMREMGIFRSRACERRLAR